MKTLTTTQKKRTTIIGAIALVVLVAIALFAVSCSAENGDGIELTESIANVVPEEASAEEIADAESISEDSELPTIESGETGTVGDEAATSATSSNDAPAQEVKRTSTDGPKPNTSGSGGASSATPFKRWVEDTQQVWVEDRAAWTEQVPVYSTKEVSICNVCGQDITGNTSAHAKAHMMAGEGSGHHSEVRKTVSGYNTVSHPAEGHYETKVVGGHWE